MRYERKYTITNLSPQLVRQFIVLHPASFRKIYPDRLVHNIYFDTGDLFCYRQNVIGASHRKKFRIRWYGNDIWNIQNPKLEVKTRTNEIGTKASYPFKTFDFTNVQAMTQIVNQTLQFQYPLLPVLINSYQRTYYGLNNERFRITIDSNVQYFSLLTANRFTRFTIKQPQTIIVELKYNRENDQDANQILSFLPFRQTKSSKYVTGIQLTTLL